MVAAMFDRVAIVEMLLAQGADPCAKDSGGVTAEGAARLMGAKHAPELLARVAGSHQRDR
jgi:hypothetical protein